MKDITRRGALKVLAAASASAAAACAERTTSSSGAPVRGAIEAITPLGPQWRTRDPFLFCVHHDDHYPAGNDQLGPAASLAGRNLGADFAGLGEGGWRMYHGEVVPGFPQHPHRGFETVTVVRRGLLDHADSLGAAARYGGGDVQWLTAGAGIQHAEMFPLLARDRENPLELFQIWLNLPAARKMVAPRFSMLWSASIPRQTVRDRAGRTTELTIVAGRLGDLRAPAPPPASWAAQDDSDVAIWTLKLAPGARFTLPAAARGTLRTLYAFAGSGLRVASTDIPKRHQLELRDARAVDLVAGPDGAELLLLQGRPIGEPVAQHGPFVMNTRAELEQAWADYRRTQFGGWPWPSSDPVHGREATRFARHADGHVDRPA
ncbi:MAG: pirin family protein [Deltaproteobacteria bacterium]|nr:pirin family protein [Deltaproteobacteria bacterium]